MPHMFPPTMAEVPCPNCGHMLPEQLWDWCWTCEGTQRVGLELDGPIDLSGFGL